MIITHVELDETIEKGHGIWKNNCSFFQNEVFLEEFEFLWFNWKDQYESQGPIKSWISCKKEVKLFLMDIGKIFAEQKREAKEKENQDLKNLRNQTLLPNNTSVAINHYLNHKKSFVKIRAYNKLKEKVEHKRYVDFIQREKPTKCFFFKSLNKLV